MISVKTVWHLEKEGRHLFIDKGSGKKECTLIISKTDGTQFIAGCSIRAATHETAKKLRLKKYILLTEETFVTLGPFFIRIDKTTDPDGAVNVLVEDGGISYYFLNSPPQKPRFFGESDIILLPADKNPENKDEISDFIHKSNAKNIIISGEFSDIWLPALKNLCVTRLEQHIQLEIQFI